MKKFSIVGAHQLGIPMCMNFVAQDADQAQDLARTLFPAASACSTCFVLEGHAVPVDGTPVTSLRDYASALVAKGASSPVLKRYLKLHVLCEILV